MKLTLVILAIILSLSGFSQSKKQDSTLALPPVVTLRFTIQQVDLFNAILSGQDVSHKAWGEFVEQYNRQLTAQLIHVPVRKDSTVGTSGVIKK